MTGRYVIYTPRESWLDSRRFDTAWHKFVALCRSLDRDGLGYEIQFNLGCNRPHVLVEASGTAKPRRQSSTRIITLPPPIPAQRCRESAVEAEWFLPENAARRNSHTSYWRRRQARYQELSRMADEQLRAELEYWQELELISGQRQHFKPGSTCETVYQDDEVAA